MNRTEGWGAGNKPPRNKERPPGRKRRPAAGSNSSPGDESRRFLRRSQDSKEVKFNNCDGRLRNYLEFLRVEHGRCLGGQRGYFFLRCGWSKFYEFLATGDTSARYAAWSAVQICCTWLARLEGGAQKKAAPLQKIGEPGHATKSVDVNSTPLIERDLKAKEANSTAGKVAAKVGVSTHKAKQALAVSKDKEVSAKVASGEVKLKDAVKSVQATSWTSPGSSGETAKGSAIDPIQSKSARRLGRNPLVLPQKIQDKVFNHFWKNDDASRKLAYNFTAALKIRTVANSNVFFDLLVEALQQHQGEFLSENSQYQKDQKGGPR